MRRVTRLSGVVAAVMLAAGAGSPALAHQPWYEDEDSSAAAPWRVPDSTISQALFFTLDRPGDVDAIAVDAKAGLRTSFDLLTPQLPAQAGFAPNMALVDCTLHVDVCAAGDVTALSAANALIMQGVPARGTFSKGGEYWTHQGARVTLPNAGRYILFVWHPAGAVGRYLVSMGGAEIAGGDRSAAKRDAFFTPVQAQASGATAAVETTEDAPRTFFEALLRRIGVRTSPSTSAR